MNRKTLVTLFGLLVITSLLAACGTTEVIKTVEVEVTKVVEVETVVTEVVEVETVVTEVVEVEVTPEVVESEEAPSFVSLASLAESIQAGDVEVGDEFGMGLEQRFHTIHATIAVMACTQCHVQEAPEEVAGAADGSPGVVDRRVCLGCHLNGPAQLLYEPKE